ncbi:MAG: phage head morphogenesis protein [Bacteroidales bacterium]|nr:phage head morphogenesis protein [Bacteroidales bacterium]
MAHLPAREQDGLLRETARLLMQGAGAGYGKNMVEAAWDSPDFKTLEKLTENVYHFAGAKNFHELRDITDALRDGDRLRSFEEFHGEADKIIGKYNREWLRTEYSQAVAASQAAARWNGFEQNKDGMPFLQYQAIMDVNTRPEHAGLNGIIKRMNDPFWSQYYPPNGYGCRCEAVQMPKSSCRETPDTKITLPPVPEMFKVNFGKQGVAFPQGHPFFKRLPKEQVHLLKERSRMEVRRIIRNAEEFKKLDANTDYKDVKFDFATGGLKATHREHNFDPQKGHYEKDVQNIGYQHGNAVVFGAEKGKGIGIKYTEGTWNYQNFEIRGCETGTAGNIRSGLKHCAIKGDTKIAVLYFPEKNFTQAAFDEGLIKYNGLKTQPGKQYLKFEKIICIQNGEIILEINH